MASSEALAGLVSSLRAAPRLPAGPIAGCPHIEVHDDDSDGMPYYHDPASGESFWELPAEALMALAMETDATDYSLASPAAATWLTHWPQVRALGPGWRACLPQRFQ